jgi:hypothetical protein
MAAPTIDHTIEKVWPLKWSVKGSEKRGTFLRFPGTSRCWHHALPSELLRRSGRLLRVE